MKTAEELAEEYAIQNYGKPKPWVPMPLMDEHDFFCAIVDAHVAGQKIKAKKIMIEKLKEKAFYHLDDDLNAEVIKVIKIEDAIDIVMKYCINDVTNMPNGLETIDGDFK